MKIPATIWNYSSLTEALRILSTAYQIRNYFYTKKGFYVLPYSLAQQPKVVFFPNLPYKKIKNFWQKVKLSPQLLLEKNDPIINQLIQLLPAQKPDFLTTQKKWQNNQIKIWQKLSEFLPKYFSEVKILEIRSTIYGSICSAYSFWLKDKSKIIIYLRSDADYSHIIEAMLIDRLNKLSPASYRSWEQLEAVQDFLISETVFASYFQNYQPTITNLNQKQQGKLAKESKDYLRFLGFPMEEFFTIKNSKIYLKNKPLVNLFSPTEEDILTYLINHKNQVVSFDQIADIIWKDQSDEKFSLYAISKTVERLRKKIELAGVFPEIIQTVKKKGYLLIS